MVNKYTILILFFSLLLLFSVVMILYNATTDKIQFSQEGSTTSSVTIQKYFSITMSTNLLSGVLFGTVNQLPAADLEATHNTDEPPGSTMWLELSVDSNTDVDFCVKAQEALTNGGDTIALNKETYSHSTITDTTNPDMLTESALTLLYVKTGTAIAGGGKDYYRFWLDIDAATPPGTYTNTLWFKGVETTTAC